MLNKRYLIMLIAVAMVLLLAACGSDNGGSNGGNSGNTNKAASNENSGNQKSDGAEEATADRERVEISIMGNFSTADISEADRAIFDRLEEALNVKINFIVPPATGYKEQLQLSLISGDYADLIFFPSESDEAFLNAVNDGLLTPINPYLKDLPSIEAHTYDISWESLDTKRDGNIYAVPRTSVARNDGFIVREDWLRNLGIEVPENREVTIEQFAEIMRRFTTDDPDGNGKHDTYGYASFHNTSKLIEPILSAQFGNLGWQKSDSGEYAYMTPMYDQNSDVFKKILAFTQTAFKEGWVDPDAAVIDRTASNDRFARGVTGIRAEFAGNAISAEKTGKEQDPNTEISYLFIKDEQGDLKGISFGTAIWGVWGLAEKAKHPLRTLEVLDWLLSDEGWELVKYGAEGVEYNLENGERVYIPDVASPWRKNIVRRANDGDFFIDPSSPSEAREKVRPWVNRAIETVQFSLDKGYIPTASKEPVFMDFRLVWDETITKIMIGELPVDAFDDLLEQWYQKGGKAYVEEMNEYIASTQ